MGRRGPPPKPTALKLVAGNPGRRPLNTAEPVPPAGEPPTPDFVLADARVKSVWDQLVPRLATTGLARSIDGLVLGRYCAIFVMWKDAAAFVLSSGNKYPVRGAPEKGKKVGPVQGFKQFPDAGVVARYNRELLALEREFGLTPASRSRITLDMGKAAKGDVNELKRRFFRTTNLPPA